METHGVGNFMVIPFWFLVGHFDIGHFSVAGMAKCILGIFWIGCPLLYFILLEDTRAFS